MTQTQEDSMSPDVVKAAAREKIKDGCQLMEGGAGGEEPRSWALRRVIVQSWRFAKSLLERLYGWLRRRVALRTRLRAAVARGLAKTREQRGMAQCNEDLGAGGERSLKAASTERTRGWAVEEFQAGDWVRVRTMAEIERTLDAQGRCHGCGFQAPMAQWCGQRLRVARRVNRFFDEARWRMVKCTNVVLLEGVFCDGSGLPDTRGCDRQCYCFWRTEWLERADAPKQ